MSERFPDEVLLEVHRAQIHARRAMRESIIAASGTLLTPAQCQQIEQAGYAAMRAIVEEHLEWLKILNLAQGIYAPHGDPAEMLRKLPDDKFRSALFAASMTMQMVRDEAILRGIALAEEP